ncbi:uncharacterized protein PHACADRAFT_253253 [Phanerochaete carnosa HHB-10118-sp]|uniref:Uncharacterized protein n=1 Tax=Phanerochaete carnosa (strain HHB-10118-sp) TaxID=650164 RepID=K5X0E6_PHACS|nr:uncharacterized protein PHACADRAFT_253253 [Phanerochaete carnosa HHB-10118-sp]EKM56237.1 hypothetical protein PHACADRAFT_253253 [Phanerochaete carnosa HHB-10118-sp]
MKAFFVLASLAACALAQRLHIQEPTAGQTVSGSGTIIVELEQDQSLGPLVQTSVLIAMNNCFDVCSEPDQWGPATVLYNGPFNPQFNSSAPEKGHYQDFAIQLPGFQSGGAIIQVAHQFQEGGATLSNVFDYSTVQVNVQ